MKQYTIGILLFADFSKVLLIKKNAPEWQAGNYNLPGGKVEQDEEPIKCVNREFYEEAGIGVPREDWKYIGAIRNAGENVSNGEYEVHIFTALYHYARHGETWSSTEEVVEWFKVKELPKNILSNLNWLIPFAINCHEQGNNYDKLMQGVFKYEFPVVAVNQ